MTSLGGEVKSHPISITPNNLVVVVNVFAALGENVIVTQKFISLLKQISEASLFRSFGLNENCYMQLGGYVNNNPKF